MKKLLSAILLTIACFNGYSQALTFQNRFLYNTAAMGNSSEGEFTTLFFTQDISRGGLHGATFLNYEQLSKNEKWGFGGTAKFQFNRFYNNLGFQIAGNRILFKNDNRCFRLGLQTGIDATFPTFDKQLFNNSYSSNIGGSIWYNSKRFFTGLTINKILTLSNNYYLSNNTSYSNMFRTNLAFGYIFGNTEKFSYTPSLIYDFYTYNSVNFLGQKSFNLTGGYVFTHSFLIKNLVVTEIGIETAMNPGFFFNLGLVKRDKFKILASYKSNFDSHFRRNNAEIMFNYRF
jgi:hypothetical protein